MEGTEDFAAEKYWKDAALDTLDLTLDEEKSSSKLYSVT